MHRAAFLLAVILFVALPAWAAGPTDFGIGVDDGVLATIAAKGEVELTGVPIPVEFVGREVMLMSTSRLHVFARVLAVKPGSAVPFPVPAAPALVRLQFVCRQ